MYKEKRSGCSGCLVPIILFIVGIVLSIIIVCASHPEIFDFDDISADTTDISNTTEGQTRDGDLLWYNQLDTTEKAIYDGLLKELDKGSLTCTFTEIDYNAYAVAIDRAALALSYDYPEYFWLTGGYTSTGHDIPYTTVQDDITINLNTYEFWNNTADNHRYTEALRGKIDYVVSLASQCTNTFDKVRCVHDYITKNVIYDHENLEEAKKDNPVPDSKYIYTAYGCLLNGKAVCAGYARAFQLIMTELGYDCAYVSGDAGGSHAWNIIKLDGEYYFIDTTWDDADFTDEKLNLIYSNETEYEYFCVTSKELSKTHTADEESFDVPDCNGTKYNYYVHEGLILSSYDMSSFDKLVTKQSKSAKIAAVKFESIEEFNKAKAELFDNSKWSELTVYSGKDEISYICDEEHLVIKLFL